MVDPNSLLDQLNKLLDSQWQELIFRLKINRAILSPNVAPQNQRNIELIRLFQQQEDGLQRLQVAVNELVLPIEKTRRLFSEEVSDTVDRIIQKHEFFVSRPEQGQIDRFLSEHHHGLLLVKAGAGYGKTSLLANWIIGQQDNHYFIVRHFFNQGDKTHSLVNAYQHLLGQLCEYFEYYPESVPESEAALRSEIYHLLRNRDAKADHPLVIVLDALDEAEDILQPFFQRQLSKSIFVIVSARADEGEEPEYLRGWMEYSPEVICLERLPREAIVEWLKTADAGQLAVFAEDNNFIAQLDEVTQGYPLYLRFLVEELIQAKPESLQAILDNSPRKFGDYVKDQFRKLAQLEKVQQSQEIKKLFALLSVALGLLAEDDIERLTGLNTWDLPALPWQVTRWFSTQAGYYSFSHPLLAQEFRRILGRQADSITVDLINYCSQWQQNHSSYALRHYADHLKQEHQFDKLYELARCQDFLKAQRKYLVGEVNLPLKTLQIVLSASAETNNAAVMAEFLLKHAHQHFYTIAQECPLKILRDGSLDKALALVKLYEPQPELYVLWNLLLAWELKETGRKEEASKILEQLLREKLPRFDSSGIVLWRCNVLVYSLAYVFEVNPHVCIELGQRVLSEDYFWSMCMELCNRGYCTEAFEIQRSQIEQKLIGGNFNTFSKVDQSQRITERQAESEIDQLQRIAKIQAEKVSKDAALESISKIAELLLIPGWELVFAPAWAELASFQVSLGKENLGKISFRQAVSIAKRNQYQARKVQEFLNIIDCQGEAGKINPLFLEDALELLQSSELQGISDSSLYLKVIFQAKKAKIQTLLFRKREAQETLKEAQLFVDQIDDSDDRIECWAAINEVRVEIGELNDTFKIENEELESHLRERQQIEEHFSATQKKITSKGQEDVSLFAQKAAIDYTQSNDFDKAVEVASYIDNPKIQEEVIETIAFNQIKFGNTEDARSTLAVLLTGKQYVEIATLKTSTFIRLANIQLNAGVKQAALTTVEIAAQYIEETKDRFVKARFSGYLAEQWAELNRTVEAEKAFYQALEIAKEIRAEQEQSKSWNLEGKCSQIFANLARIQARMGNFDAALENVGMIIHASRLKSGVLRSIAQEQVKLGENSTHWEKLKRLTTAIYKEVENSLDPVQTLSMLAVTEFISGNQQVALEILKELREHAEGRDRSRILAELAIAEIQVQGVDAAFETLEEIEDPECRIYVLWSVAKFQFRQDLKTEMLSTLDATCKAYDKLKDEQKRLEAMQKIVIMQAMAGLSHQALQAAEQIIVKRNSMYSALAEIYAEAGDLESFKQLLIPCAHYIDVAYEMCSWLAKFYPEKSADIVRAVDKDY